MVTIGGVAPFLPEGSGFDFLAGMPVDNRAEFDAARAGGDGLALLVGDAPYYARFGFAPVPPGALTLPGPVDPARFLAAELTPGALERPRGRVVALR